MDNQQEIFPIVNENGTVVGSATRGECHGGSMLLHPVVHLHVFNSVGDIAMTVMMMGPGTFTLQDWDDITGELKKHW